MFINLRVRDPIGYAALCVQTFASLLLFFICAFILLMDANQRLKNVSPQTSPVQSSQCERPRPLRVDLGENQGQAELPRHSIGRRPPRIRVHYVSPD